MENLVAHFFNGLKGKKIALCGVGVSNAPLAEKFSDYGAHVIICDKRAKEELTHLSEKVKNSDIEYKLGDGYLDDLQVDIIVCSPGAYFNLEKLCQYRKQGVVVTSEMELFFDLCPAKIIAVTGSNGKTTTTTIISELLKKQGKKVYLGGNIGKALLPLVEEMTPDDFAVVELSSFQLISMRKSPDIAVITNIAPNHLDVHSDMAEYINAKRNIYLHQNAFSRTVLNLEDDIVSSFSKDARGHTLFFSRHNKPAYGAYMAENGDIFMSVGGNDTFIMNRSIIRIPGNHNVENYLAAISAVWGFVDISSICAVAQEFNGVEHRAEFVRTVGGVRYFNDSIATAPSRTMQGTLSLYDKKIILIAGGYDKNIPFDELGYAIAEKVKTVVLIGVTAQKIYQAIINAKNYSEGNPQILFANDMASAVKMASKVAQDGDIVSLSPACASFDMYPNFEARGKHFKEIIVSM